MSFQEEMKAAAQAAEEARDRAVGRLTGVAAIADELIGQINLDPDLDRASGEVEEAGEADGLHGQIDTVREKATDLIAALRELASQANVAARERAAIEIEFPERTQR